MLEATLLRTWHRAGRLRAVIRAIPDGVIQDSKPLFARLGLSGAGRHACHLALSFDLVQTPLKMQHFWTVFLHSSNE